MKKNLLFKLLIMAIILTLSVTVMISCTPEDVPDDNTLLETTAYEIPENLAINIEIYEGNTDASNLKGTIVKDTLLLITQQIVPMTTVNDFGTETVKTYVAYSVNELVAKLEITLPVITSVKAIASDDYVDEYQITSFANSYISIGFEDNEVFGVDEKNGVPNTPRFISDKTSTSSKSVAKKIAKIIVNPVSVASQKYAIPDDLVINIEIYEANDDTASLKGTITNATLLAITQQIVSMTTIKNEIPTTTLYVAYSLNEIIAELEIALPAEITSVYGVGTDLFGKDYVMTAFDKSYITIGFEVEDAFAADEKGGVVNSPRFITDIDSTSSSTVAKMIAKIIINPIAG